MRDFRYIDGAAILKLNEQACIGCGICVTVCPHRVFTLGKNKASITDYNAAWNAGPAPPTARPRPFTSTQTTAAAARLIINRWLSRIMKKRVDLGCC